MTLKLYYDLFSPPSRAIYIFLKKCNIPFEKKIINLGKLEQFTEGYEKIHPFNKIPAIEHDGFNLTESATILRYLCNEFKVDDHWYPNDIKARARVDESLDWQCMNTKLHGSLYFQLVFLDPLFKGINSQPEEIAKSKNRLMESLNLVENIWLKDKNYMGGNIISIADLVNACDIQQPRLTGYNPCEGRPKLTAWLNRVINDTSPFYEEAHVHLNKFAVKSERTRKEQ